MTMSAAKTLFSPKALWSSDGLLSPKRASSVISSVSRRKIAEAYEKEERARALVRTRVDHAIHDLDEDILGPTEQHDNTIHFWACLSKEQKLAMCRVTEDLPLAVRDLGGLMNPFKSLLHGGVKMRILLSVMLLIRLMLNVFTTAVPAYHLFRNEPLVFRTPLRNTTLFDGQLTVCRDITLDGRELKNTASLNGQLLTGAIIDCDTFNVDPFKTRKVTFCFEAFIIVGASLMSLIFTIAFLLKNDSFPEDGSGKMRGSARANFIMRRPFVLVFLPRIAVSFSALQPIALISTSCARKWLVRGDLAMYVGLVFKSLFPHRNFAEWLFIERSVSGVGYIVRFIAEGLLVILLVLLGMQALLHKLIMLYISISFVRWTSWHTRSFLLFLGFVNQMVGVFDHDIIELNRALLLRFGGKDGTWSAARMHSVHQWFGLVFSRLVQGRIRSHDCSGLMALAAMFNFDSDTVQHMWLSRKRASSLEAVREDRLAVFEAMLHPGLYGQPREARLESMHSHLRQCQREHDEVWETLCMACGGEQETIRSSILHHAERVRLLAELQAHMADLHDHKAEDSEEEDATEIRDSCESSGDDELSE